MQSRKKQADFTQSDWEARAAHIDAQRKAHALIKKAVQLGALPPPYSLECVVCHKPALFYHHPNGYTGKAALDVVPTCNDCHSKLHSDYPPTLVK